jgi:hypothetical protein
MMAFKNRHSIEATRTNAERLLTEYIGDAGQAAALHVTNKISAERARWIEQNVVLHECSERPHVPCPGCLAEKAKQSV